MEDQTGAPIEGMREETLDPRGRAAKVALGYRARRRHSGRCNGVGTRRAGRPTRCPSMTGMPSAPGASATPT